MTWRNWAWNGKFIWFFVGIVLLFAVIGAAVFLDETTSTTDRLIVVPILLVVTALLLIMHNWITVEPGSVKIGYFPFYRKTMQYSEISDLSMVDIQPVREFGGWGVKGLARSRNGLLLGGYPARGLRIETRDDRRYVVTFPNPEPILQALAQHGLTLSAVPEHETSEEV